MINIEQIFEHYDDVQFKFANNFDAAIIGVDESTMRIIYSVKKCIDILISENMSEEEALEYFDYNVSGSYVGEDTPIWCYDIF